MAALFLKSRPTRASWLAWAGVLVGSVLLAACATPGASQSGHLDAAPSAQPPSAVSAPVNAVEPPPPPPPPSAAQTALADGVKAYQDGRYKAAEAQLKVALKGGLAAPAEVVEANKHLAFIYCMSRRYVSCKAAFRAAKAADPAFALSKAEAGHPMWAKTYRSAMAAK